MIYLAYPYSGTIPAVLVELKNPESNDIEVIDSGIERQVTYSGKTYSTKTNFSEQRRFRLQFADVKYTQMIRLRSLLITWSTQQAPFKFIDWDGHFYKCTFTYTNVETTLKAFEVSGLAAFSFNLVLEVE